MIKKYVGFYKEAAQTAVAFPRFVLFLLLMNLPIVLNSLPITGTLELVLYPLNSLLKIAAMAGVGYVVVKLLRTGKAPEHVFSRGVMGYFWLMVKLMLFQLFLTTLAWFLPVHLLEQHYFLTPIMRSIWYRFVEFIFVFFIFEAVFWEDKGLMAGYRMRNIYLLDRFEWVFLVYLVVKLPHLAVEFLPYWGWGWLLTPWGVALLFVLVSLLDWVNLIFSFKVFGADRLQVAQEMEERIKEMEKGRRKKKGKQDKKK